MNKIFLNRSDRGNPIISEKRGRVVSVPVFIAGDNDEVQIYFCTEEGINSNVLDVNVGEPLPVGAKVSLFAVLSDGDAVVFGSSRFEEDSTEVDGKTSVFYKATIAIPKYFDPCSKGKTLICDVAIEGESGIKQTLRFIGSYLRDAQSNGGVLITVDQANALLDSLNKGVKKAEEESAESAKSATSAASSAGTATQAKIAAFDAKKDAVTAREGAETAQKEAEKIRDELTDSETGFPAQLAKEVTERKEADTELGKSVEKVLSQTEQNILDHSFNNPDVTKEVQFPDGYTSIYKNASGEVFISQKDGETDLIFKPRYYDAFSQMKMCMKSNDFSLALSGNIVSDFATFAVNQSGIAMGYKKPDGNGTTQAKTVSLNYDGLSVSGNVILNAAIKDDQAVSLGQIKTNVLIPAKETGTGALKTVNGSGEYKIGGLFYGGRQVYQKTYYFDNTVLGSGRASLLSPETGISSNKITADHFVSLDGCTKAGGMVIPLQAQFVSLDFGVSAISCEFNTPPGFIGDNIIFLRYVKNPYLNVIIEGNGIKFFKDMNFVAADVESEFVSMGRSMRIITQMDAGWSLESITSDNPSLSGLNPASIIIDRDTTIWVKTKATGSIYDVQLKATYGIANKFTATINGVAATFTENGTRASYPKSRKQLVVTPIAGYVAFASGQGSVAVMKIKGKENTYSVEISGGGTVLVDVIPIGK